MATPGVVDEVRKPPTSMGPFSKDTFTGTRPLKATGLLFFCPGDNVMEGSEEMTPITALSYGLLALISLPLLSFWRDEVPIESFKMLSPSAPA